MDQIKLYLTHINRLFASNKITMTIIMVLFVIVFIILLLEVFPPEIFCLQIIVKKIVDC